MLIETNVTPNQIIEHLLLPHCSLIENAVRIETPGNSIVLCSQWFPIFETAQKCFPTIPIDEIKIGINFVEITGLIPAEEEMHVHISMLVAIVVEGSGIIIYEKDGQELREKVGKGAMVFVPKNTLHYFEGDPTIKYSAIEFGPNIDYQKHHKEL
jgi:mannose-6-phosphate isomerase-like protein (cupin superfamily)